MKIVDESKQNAGSCTRELCTHMLCRDARAQNAADRKAYPDMANQVCLLVLGDNLAPIGAQAPVDSGAFGR